MKTAPVIIIDTREQDPWSFSSWRGDEVQVVWKKLETGDYSIVGLETRCTVERKSLDDLVHTLCRDRDRFLRELERMTRMDYAAVVVEAPLEAALLGRYTGGMTPNSLLGWCTSIEVDWGIPVHFSGSRGAAAAWTLETLFRFARRASSSETPLCESTNQTSSRAAARASNSQAGGENMETTCETKEQDEGPKRPGKIPSNRRPSRSRKKSPGE